MNTKEQLKESYRYSFLNRPETPNGDITFPDVDRLKIGLAVIDKLYNIERFKIVNSPTFEINDKVYIISNAQLSIKSIGDVETPMSAIEISDAIKSRIIDTIAEHLNNIDGNVYLYEIPNHIYIRDVKSTTIPQIVINLRYTIL